MNIPMVFLLFATSLLTNVNGAISFDIHAFASANPCDWVPCEGLANNTGNYTISCCTLRVPLNYAKPNETLISISMTRFSPSNRSSNNFLFTLSGGPGRAGIALATFIFQLIPAEYGVTVIGPDHRGTGLSTPLGCDDENSQTVTMDCITYLKNRWTVEGLNQFSTTSAAHDVAVQIQAAQLIGRISIIGISYGTYWLDRFLTIYPNLVQSAIMDGPVNPLLISMSMYGIQANSVALQYLSYCNYQIECIENFPNGSPITMLSNILQDIDSNKQQCINTYFSKYNITSQIMKSIFFSMLSSTETHYDRTVIPAIIFRLNRCNQDDVAALDYFYKYQSSPSVSLKQATLSGATGLLLHSQILYCNIVFSELWSYLNQSEVDRQTLNIWQKAAIIAPPIAPDPPSDYIALKDAWPKYSMDEYRYRLANSSILMMAGELDVATTFDLAVHLATIARKTRTLYTIPLTGHGQLLMAQMEYTCPLQLIFSWAFPTLFPSEWSDPTCIKNLPTTIDFVGKTKMTQASSLKLLNVELPFGATTEISENGTSSTYPTTEISQNGSSSIYSTTVFIFIFSLIYVL